METLEAVILGIVQGLTEFLPVSSSGHLQIAKALLGVEIEENLAFDITLHAATVLSTIVVPRGEVVRLLRGMFSFGRIPDRQGEEPNASDRNRKHRIRLNDEQAYVLKLAISMIPVGIVGFACKDRIDAMLGSPYILTVVGSMLLLTALLLAFAYYARPRAKETISYRDAFIIGIAQAAAAMPGLSRSGSTIATGLLLGNRKESVAQFSFLTVLAPILGEMFLELVKGGISFDTIGAIPVAAGFAAAFVTGCLACKFMIGIVKRGKLIWFAIYCAIAGIVSIICTFI